MANRRFIDFPIATTVGDSDIILIWQSGVNKQTTKATFLSGLPENLDELNDVAISGLTNGQILRYDSVTGKWENTDQGNLDLNDLNDVSIVSPSNGQVLVYNSSTSKWENSSGGFVPYTGAVTTVNLGAQTIQAGQFVKAGGTSSQFLKADGSVDSTAYGTGSVTSVGLTMPSAFNVANSPITTNGTLAVTGAGTVAQYIRGDGSLADFPESSGGGSSVSYYLNGSISQGTIGGVAYRELSKVPILGAGTDFIINADGYIASFITDAGDPNLLEIPGGNWNLETYFSASSGGGSPTFYVELYKVNSGGTATLIASNSGSPELIAFGTNLTAYFSSIAVPTTTLALTDRLAIRYYVAHSGRTITMHTENNHLCQIITTFTTGLTALNGLTAQVQNFATGTTGTDFNISSATATHTFNLPTASGTNRGALSSTDWTTFNNKENAITAGTTAQYFRGDKTFQTLNTSVVPEGTNLYYTEARVNANTNVAANTAARHNALTLGTANGLSLSTQVLSLGLASAGVTGALSGTDWSTFNNKQNALTNPVTGTGTTNYLAKFTGSTTVGNSQVFDNGTNVGIGTATPNDKFHVVGGIYSTSLTTPTNTNISAIQIGYDGTNGVIRTWNYSPLIISNFNYQAFETSGSERFRISSTGFVSAGAVTNGRLGVRGFTNDSSGYAFEAANASGNTLFIVRNDGVSTFTGNVGIGTYSPVGLLHAKSAGAYGAVLVDNTGTTGGGYFASLQNGSTKGIIAVTGAIEGNTTSDFGMFAETGGALRFYVNGSATRSMSLTSGGNLLVGTTTDVGYKLHVNGNINLSIGGNRSIRIGSATNYYYDLQSTNDDFQIIEAGTTPRLTIKYPNGNVGIGTSSPGARLNIAGNLGAVVGAGNSAIRMTNTDSGNWASIGAGIVGVDNPGMQFSVDGTSRMVITGGGNVGIGVVPSAWGSGPALQVLGLGLSTRTSLPSLAQFSSNQYWDGSNHRYINSNFSSIYTQNSGAHFFDVAASGTAGAAISYTNVMSLQNNGNVLIGTTTDNGNRLRVNGVGFFDQGVRTGQPVGTTTNNWLLGRALASGTSTPNRWIRVQIGLEYYDILAVYMGTL